MMKKPVNLGCLVSIDYDEWSDLGFIVPVFSKKDKRVIDCRFRAMVHPLSDSTGVKLWFELEEVIDD